MFGVFEESIVVNYDRAVFARRQVEKPGHYHTGLTLGLSPTLPSWLDRNYGGFLPEEANSNNSPYVDQQLLSFYVALQLCFIFNFFVSNIFFFNFLIFQSFLFFGEEFF